MAVPRRAMEPVNAFLKLKNGLKMKNELPKGPKHSSSAFGDDALCRRGPTLSEWSWHGGGVWLLPLSLEGRHRWFGTDPFFVTVIRNLTQNCILLGPLGPVPTAQWFL